MILWLLTLAVAGSAAAWRFLPESAGFAASGASLLLTLWVARWRVPAAWLLSIHSLMAAALGVLGRFELLWPCELSCSLGEPFASVRGIPVPGLAALLLLLLSASAGRDVRRRRLGLLSRGMAWSAVGASLYYLLLSVRLGMVCSHCLAVHTVVLSFLAVLLAGRASTLLGLLVAALSAGGLHGVYRWSQSPPPPPVAPEVPAGDPVEVAADREPEAVGAPPPAGGAALDPEQSALLERADQGRRVGRGAALLRVEFVFSFLCGHCAEKHAPTMNALRDLCQHGKVELVWRWSFAPQDRDSRAMAQLAFAAAARGELAALSAVAFGAARRPAGAGALRRGPAARLLGHLQETESVRPCFELVSSQPQVFEELARRESEWLKSMPLRGELPQVLLVEIASGQVLGQWHGEEYQPSLLGTKVRAELERLRPPR